MPINYHNTTALTIILSTYLPIIKNIINMFSDHNMFCIFFFFLENDKKKNSYIKMCLLNLLIR